jgi:hypothetical protein
MIQLVNKVIKIQVENKFNKLLLILPYWNLKEC